MAKDKKDSRFKDSCAFILTNLDITTDKLTDTQLDYWSVKDANNEQEQFDLFMFAHTMYTMQKQGHGQITLNVQELNTRFEIFKTILSLEKLKRKESVNYIPKKIFDFDSYDVEINIEIGEQISNSTL